MGFLFLNSDYAIECGLVASWSCVDVEVSTQADWQVLQYVEQSISPGWQETGDVSASSAISWYCWYSVAVNTPQSWVIGDYVPRVNFTSPLRTKEDYK